MGIAGGGAKALESLGRTIPFGSSQGEKRGDGMSELIIYQSDDGKAQVQFRAMDGSLWLSQLQLAELYGVTVANINIHLRKIVQEGELAAEAVIK